MGRFEELVQQAKDGDADALDALETEFSGSALREKAESADAFKTNYEKSLPLIRKAKFAEFFEQLDDDLKASGLTAEALGEFDPEGLTLDIVKEKAKSSLDAAQESRLALAKESGFDNVEEFEKAMLTVKAQADTRRASMEAVGAGASSSGGEPSATGEGKTHAEITTEAFDKAKKDGLSDDRALGVSISALIDAQLEEGPE